LKKKTTPKNLPQKEKNPMSDFSSSSFEDSDGEDNTAVHIQIVNGSDSDSDEPAEKSEPDHPHHPLKQLHKLLTYGMIV
jgi:hypothetical protein